jgi:hypothetical protein
MATPGARRFSRRIWCEGDARNLEFVCECRATALARDFKEGEQFLELAFLDLSERAAVDARNARGAANNFAHHAAALHDADCAKSFMANTDVASGHDEVVDVPRVEAAVGQSVAIVAINTSSVNGDGYKGLFGKLGSMLLLRIVKVDGPSTRYATIGEIVLRDDIFLG